LRGFSVNQRSNIGREQSGITNRQLFHGAPQVVDHLVSYIRLKIIDPQRAAPLTCILKCGPDNFRTRLEILEMN
jgi:hypothetical protein